MARYVAAFDSSGNGMYYAVVLCDEYVFKELIDEVTRSVSRPHMIEDKVVRNEILKSIEKRLGKGVIAICMKVHLASIKSYIRDLSPRLSKKRIERVAYTAIGKLVLVTAQKHLPPKASIALWYADRGDAAEILKLVGVENLRVDKVRSSPADVVAWINHRGTKLEGLIEVDARSLLQFYARQLLKD